MYFWFDFCVQVYTFPVQSSFTEDVQQCLPMVLSEKQPVILKVEKPNTITLHIILFQNGMFCF